MDGWIMGPPALLLGQVSGVCPRGTPGLIVLSVRLSRWTICCPRMVTVAPVRPGAPQMQGLFPPLDGEPLKTGRTVL